MLNINSFINLLQFIAGIILSIGYIPQIYQIIKNKNIGMLNFSTFQMMFLGMFFMELYAINCFLLGEGIMFLITNSLSLFTLGILIFFIIKYSKKRYIKEIIYRFFIIVLLSCLFFLKGLSISFFGIQVFLLDFLQLIGGFILTMGYIPQIYFIWKNKSSKGINIFTFSIITCGVFFMEIYALYNYYVLNSLGMFLITNTLALIIGILFLIEIIYFKIKKRS